MAEMTMKDWLYSLPDECIDLIEDLPPQDLQLLKGLNASQLKSVMAIDGTVLICAVAGSGKTTVLTRRIAYMLRKGINPSSILCTTFTKKATEEMTIRLGKLIPKMALTQMTIGTSHSIGYRILKKEYNEMNHHLAPAFRKDMLMNGKLKRFMEDTKKSIMNDIRVSTTVKQELNDVALPQLAKAIGLSKNEGIDAQQYSSLHTGKGPRMEAYIEFYLRYEQRKWDECVIDADDLLFNTVRLFEENPNILAKYQRIYKYLLVDEAQDNNGLQWKLMKMIAHPTNNIFIVGDDDQSMYGFRGAKPEEFIHLNRSFKRVHQIELEDNYRSNPGILQVANALIANNTERIKKSLKAHKQDQSESVSYRHFMDETDEARNVVGEIQNLHETDNHELKKMAILYRTNAQSRALEDQLIIAGLPYVIHGGVSFYERREVKDVVAYLQLAIDPNNDKSFKRVINAPKRYLGEKFMMKVEAFRGSHWQAIQGGIRMADYEKRGTREFRELVGALRQMSDKGDEPTELVDYLLENGYGDYLRAEGDEEDEGNSRLENISTLKYALSRYENVQDFLDYITVMTSNAKHSIDGVQLMTVHKSKGLEFPTTFIIGVSEGLLPHFKAIEESEDGTRPLAIEEERRLAYVAGTRAESNCYYSSIAGFNGRPSSPSRFIKEMGLKDKNEQETVDEKFNRLVVQPSIRELREERHEILEG